MNKLNASTSQARVVWEDSCCRITISYMQQSTKIIYEINKLSLEQNEQIKQFNSRFLPAD